MPHEPIQVSVVGSYPVPGWVESSLRHRDGFGPDDLAELWEDAVTVAISDQVRAGLDVITDGEQTRSDFNLSFYSFIDGIELSRSPGRRFGPPAHDQRPLHRITGELCAPRGLGVVEEYERLRRLAPPGCRLKASLPGPYTLAGRLQPGNIYPDRRAVTEALVPAVRSELEALAAAGCQLLAVDEPSMSAYAEREDRDWLVDVFNRTVGPVVGRCYLGTHLCFGNYRGRAVARRRYAPLFPDFLGLHVDELHVEMASREMVEIELLERVGEVKDVAVGLIDVKSSYIEPPELIEERIRLCLRFVPAERLAVSPDCGLSQTARWLARRKLANLVEGAARVRSTVKP